MKSYTFIKDGLKDLVQKDLKRDMKVIEGPQQKTLLINGKKVLNFCSNNYLGLADDERLAIAAIECVKKNGFGAGASRLVCGNFSAHRKLEEKIARFKGAQRCLVFSTGYMANVGVISSLFGRGDLILSDKLNHASIIDGILLSGAEHKRYAHCQMDVLEGFLKNSAGYKKKVIVTDSVFSMDGDIAPLDKIVTLAKTYECLVMIDEAHALGVMGKKGKGLAEHFGVQQKVAIQMGTLSKAVGAFGAYVCGSEELIELLMNKARSFIYTTGLPPSVAAAAQCGIEIIEKDDRRRDQLWENTRYIVKRLKSAKFNTLNSQTPIIPIMVKDPGLAMKLSESLLRDGLLLTAIRPPTVPVNTARLRLTVMATHTKEELDYCLDRLQKHARKLGII